MAARSTAALRRLAGDHALALALVVFPLALVVGWRVRPIVLLDDAAIIARYVERISSGDGWVYNVGDRTNGASAALYTMVVVVVHKLGLNTIDAIRAVGLVSYAASVSLVAYLGSRISGLVGGVVATFFILTWADYATQGLSGMESPLAAALGLATIVALLHGRDTWAGVFLGLALLDKLDAGLLALAVAVAFVVVLRRPPWRIAAVSGVVLAPWLLFSWVYFGSPLPHSFTQKAGGELVNPARVFDRTWIVDNLDSQHVGWIVVLALVSVVGVLALRRAQPQVAVALAVCVLWPAFHAAAFSLIDLGDIYSWYLAVLYPPLAVAAGCTLGFAVRLVRKQPAPVVAGAVAGTAVVAVFAAGVNREGRGGPGDVWRRFEYGRSVNDFLLLEDTRREAGQAVARLAEPGEVVATCFGWIAYEAIDNPIYETCPLNTRKSVGPPDWVVGFTFPGQEAPELNFEAELRETVLSTSTLGGRVDIGEVPDSE